MRESGYQAKLIKEIEKRLPGAIVLKNDSGYRQGIPDLTVLYYGVWAVLEVKASESEPFQPNQEYYIDRMGEMAFAAVIFPENEEVVLHDLQCTLEPGREARLSRG